MKTSTTREAICAAFMRLYSAQSYDSITVKALCAAAPVARTTFYAHYGNLDEVKAEVEDGIIAGLMAVTERVAAGDLQAMDFTRFVGEVERYIEQHWETIYAFMVRQVNYRFIEKWKAGIRTNFRRRYPELARRESYELIAEMLASAVIGAYGYWLRHPDLAGRERMRQTITRALDAIVQVL